jgi:flagellar protein FliL
MSEKPAAPEAAKKTKSKLMPMIVVGALLIAAAGGGYFWYSQRAAAAAAAAEEDDEGEGEGEGAEDEAHGGEDQTVDASQGADNGHGPASKKPSKKKRKKHDAEGAHARLMSFEPFVVNLADPGAARFLRTNIQLVVSGGTDQGGVGHGGGAKGPSIEDMRARSAILELLSAQTSDTLTTPEGKTALKQHIVERVQSVLDESRVEVEDVLFSDFVIQF